MTIEEKYISHVESCFEKSLKGESKITDEIIAIEGMIGLQTRHLYNNILSMEDARYLEIGCWKGASSCAAMSGNKATVTLIENFAGFGGPKWDFLANLESHIGDNDVSFYEEDCFLLDTAKLKNKFNIYLWDADHSEHSTRMGIQYYLPVLDDIFILIMDDWNMKDVREGTYNAIGFNNLEVIWNKEIRLTDDDQFTHNHEEAAATWWNGIACFILKKPST